MSENLANKIATSGTQCWQYNVHMHLGGMSATAELLVLTPHMRKVSFGMQVAMYAHRSQLVWFRLLYVVFSRYMITNTYKPIQRSLSSS